MKPLLRSAPVSRLLGLLVWGWMVLINRTTRWSVEGDETARAAFSAGNGVVVAAWHSRIMLLPAGWVRMMRHWPGRRAPGAMLISLSPDGEPVNHAIAHLGLQSIRGSKTNKKKRDKNKGGARAIAEAVQLLRAGGALCITPDGPRGPAGEVSLGAVLMAQRSGAPLLPYALSVSHARRLKTWDRFILPFPFARGAIVFGPPVYPAAGKRPQDLQAELQAGLDEATRRADALVAAPARRDGRRLRDAA